MKDDVRYILKAPGKVIISGEHAVVYGKDALVMAIDRFVKVDCAVESNDGEMEIIKVVLCDLKEEYSVRREEVKEMMGDDMEIHKKTLRERIGKIEAYKEHLLLLLGKILSYDERKGKDDLPKDRRVVMKVSSEIPLGFGLGSSGAYNVALAKALIHFLSIDLSLIDMIKIANYGEKYYHSTPSGIDVTSCINGGLIHFSSIDQFTPIKEYHKLFNDNIRMILINTGIKRNTKEFIMKVSQYKTESYADFHKAIDSIGEITIRLKELITNPHGNANDVEEIGSLINENQRLLKQIHVSNETIDSLCNELNAIGVPVKITGAGGGGYLLAVIDNDSKHNQFQSLMQQMSLDHFLMKPCTQGAYIIKS